MKSPLVSIIIVTHNSADYILECINSIKKSNYKSIEIILVDNASSDNTLQIVDKEKNNKLRIIKNDHNLGYAHANNQAANISNGEFLFIINPDTRVEPDFLPPLIEQMNKSESIAVCQPLVYLFDKKTVNLTGKETHYLGFDWIRDYKSKRKLRNEQIYSFSGSGVLIRKSIYVKLGGYDDLYFMYYEDSDLSWKLNLFGKKILFTPKSVLYHDYKYIPQEKHQPLKRKLFYIERNRLQTIFKNYSFKTLFLLVPAIIFMEIGMITFAIIDGWGLTKLKTYLSIMQNFETLNSNRKFIQEKRIVSDKTIMQSFKSKITFEKFSNPVIKYIVNPVLDLYYKIIVIFL